MAAVETRVEIAVMRRAGSAYEAGNRPSRTDSAGLMGKGNMSE